MRKSLYADDLISGGSTQGEAMQLKCDAGVRCDTRPGRSQISTRKEGTDHTSLGARGGAYGSQPSCECARCIARLHLSQEYLVLARQHCSATLAEWPRRVSPIRSKSCEQDTEPPEHSVATRAYNRQPGRHWQSRRQCRRCNLVVERTFVANRSVAMASRDQDPTNRRKQGRKKVQRELFAFGVEGSDDLDAVLDRFGLRKAMRVCAWISKFTHNSRHPSAKIEGALTTEEIAAQELFWVKRARRQGMSAITFAEDTVQLNLQLNMEGVWECRGRIQGEYPIYLPDDTLFTAKLVQREHVTTLYGGIGLTMAKVREKYWVPRLRKFAKKILRKCWGCKKFQAVVVKCPPPGFLPRARTEGTTPFNVIGVDFAGPVKYRSKGKGVRKAYIVLYSCSLTRGVFLELLPSLETNEFIKSFKRLVARRGRPSRVYSDNGSTFVAAAKWLKKVRKDEELNEFLCNQSISWQFNLSRAPWWGGQFERLIGLMKAAFYKTVGGGLLAWDELSEVLLDVEVTINNRPLS